MSPGDYTSNSTSPMSGGSFSAPNCSLSPGSSISQDSNNIQSNNSDYSPQQMFNECRVSGEFNQHGQTDDPQMAMNVVSDDVRSTCDNGDAFQCPICGTVSLNRYVEEYCYMIMLYIRDQLIMILIKNGNIS